MQTLIMILMALVMLAMTLKLTFHRPLVAVAWSAALLLFVSQTWPWAIEQSRMVIDSALADGALMLDMAVLMSIDVALGFAFCTIEIGSNRHKWWAVALRYVPSLLVFPVLFALLVIAVFALPGMDFATTAWMLGAAVGALAILLCYTIRWLLPEREIRLEMLFLTHMLIGLMGVIATVNGRTAVSGVNDFSLSPLLLVVALVITGVIVGMIVNRLLLNKKLKNIR